MCERERGSMKEGAVHEKTSEAVRERGPGGGGKRSKERRGGVREIIILRGEGGLREVYA